jgi:hypothetical protein
LGPGLKAAAGEDRWPSHNSVHRRSLERAGWGIRNVLALARCRCGPVDRLRSVRKCSPRPGLKNGQIGPAGRSERYRMAHGPRQVPEPERASGTFGPVHFDTSQSVTGRSALHGEQFPGPRHTFEFVLASVAELDPRSDDQVLDSS